MTDATLDVVKCESCHAPMLTCYTSDKLIFYVCPNCVDWSSSETASKPNLFFIN